MSEADDGSSKSSWQLNPKLAFLLVSLTLGELGDGLNIFQGVYLVGVGWNEGRVGIALSLMGLTALIVQPWAGDWVDKTTVDRRFFLAAASIVTALSASAILLVNESNNNHMLIFITKVIEGVAASFIGPCLAALTLASFGPARFDKIMASNILWGHVGSVVAAVLAGGVAYMFYPDVQYCFLIIGASAVVAVLFTPHLPQGDSQMGRGFHGKVAIDEFGNKEELQSSESVPTGVDQPPPQAASYVSTFLNLRTGIVCFTGFFFHFANANVLLVLGELMGQGEEGAPKRAAIPLIASAIVTAQLTMAAATSIGNRLTMAGVGRKPIFMAGLLTLPIRCALIILWRDAGDTWLLSTQVLDGLAGGFFGLLHPLLVADLTFGTGRFNVVMGLTASFFGYVVLVSDLFESSLSCLW